MAIKSYIEHRVKLLLANLGITSRFSNNVLQLLGKDMQNYFILELHTFAKKYKFDLGLNLEIFERCPDYEKVIKKKAREFDLATGIDKLCTLQRYREFACQGFKLGKPPNYLTKWS